MKNNVWKLATVVVVLTMLILGLTMLLAGCGPEEEEAATPVLVKSTATPVPSPVKGPVSAAPPTDTPTPAAAPPTDTPVPPQAEPTPPPAEIEKAAGLIDNFEGGDFDGPLPTTTSYRSLARRTSRATPARRPCV
jgi:hypothetical protein